MKKLDSCAELMDYIENIGFLPLLKMGCNWSAEEVVSDDCAYIQLPDGCWEWLLWKWKGEIIQESGCAYGKFFDRKAGFISKRWWPDFCNWRRNRYFKPEEGSIEHLILQTVKEHGSIITRDLRKACGFTDAGMRGKFDTYITRLEMGGYLVTENFVYPRTRGGEEYGWGRALLTCAETFMGREACQPHCSPEESYERMVAHFQKLFPHSDENFFRFILK